MEPKKKIIKPKKIEKGITKEDIDDSRILEDDDGYSHSSNSDWYSDRY